ncbi:MAG: cell division ATP-binding protein FtsE [Alphaproteobacteria bacterium]|nr:cell division ATP-binding protein FtsE [Alphaproteobacteria bacterium]
MVRLENVGKRYGTDAEILHDISLTLDPGGFYFLTGVSGAGKTTLLKIIYLAETPSRGLVSLFDTDVSAADRATHNALRRRIGIVFQDFRLVEHLTVRDNVALPLRIAGAAEREIRENVPELLGWMGLEDKLNYHPAQLSGGEQQRVAIARAIVRRPDLLIADEPTGNIDDEIAMLLVRIFERINRLGTTVLIATHDVAFASRFSHRHLHLDRGGLSAPKTALGAPAAAALGGSSPSSGAANLDQDSAPSDRAEAEPEAPAGPADPPAPGDASAEVQ